MSPVSRRLTLLGLGLGLLTPGLALAKPRRPKIRWTILVPERKDQARIQYLLKEILEKESKKARWGKGYTDDVDATIDVREFVSSTDHEIARVTCSAVGRIAGLGTTRSKFSYGGKVEQRAQLEKHVLELVARGIVVRLAEIAREKYDGWKVVH